VPDIVNAAGKEQSDGSDHTNESEYINRSSILSAEFLTLVQL